MKKLVILALLTLSTQVYSSQTASNLVAYTLAEVIYTVAIPLASTGATTASSEKEQKEAIQLKNDIQEYYQTGVMGLNLENKLLIAQEVDSSMSLDESLDALVEASDLILSR